MQYYFDNGNRLNISGSDYIHEIRSDVRQIYWFDHIVLPLGNAFSQFLNADIESWGNNFKALLSEMISNYDEANIHKYIAQAKSLFAEIPYFSAYHALFYSELLVFYKDPDKMVGMCRAILKFITGWVHTPPKNIAYPPGYDSSPYPHRGEIDRLKEIQILFRELAEKCLSPKVSNPLKELHDNEEQTYHERKYGLRETNIKVFDDVVIKTRFEFNKIGKGKYEAVEVHTTNDVYDICYREFIMLALNNVRVRRCGNDECNKYFVPQSRPEATLYCDDCKSSGAAMKIYQKKIKDNPLLAAYNRAYQAKYARLVKPCRSKSEVKDKRLKALKKWANDAKKRIAETEKLIGNERRTAEKELLNWLNEREGE